MCYNACMKIPTIDEIPDHDVPDNPKRIKLLRLKRFEKDLADAGIPFVFSSDTMLEGGLIAGGEQAIYKEYALEVYNLCTSGLQLPHQQKYDELLDFIEQIKINPNYVREYHFNGNETGLKDTPLFKAELAYLFEYAFYVGSPAFNTSLLPHGVIQFFDKDYLKLTAWRVVDSKTGKLCLDEELLFYLLVKTDEIMEDFDFHLE